MSLITELIVRVIIIVTLTDALLFYIINKQHRVITVPFVISIILVTIVPLVINIWYVLYRRGIR